MKSLLQVFRAVASAMIGVGKKKRILPKILMQQKKQAHGHTSL
jgi:hypothetical protein